MALIVTGTNYSGEVLEQILTRATTRNELVDKGLIHLEPGVSDKLSIPRVRSGKMLQKRKEMPDAKDAKGDFKYSEQVLKPKDFMAFTTFNPRSFEKIWRKWQPKGNLVFSELPAEAQNMLLSELAKQVEFEVGAHLINGVFVDDENDDEHLFDGVVTRIVSNNDTIKVVTSETTQIGRLKALFLKIPKTLRQNPNLRILMSMNDWDKYDDELSAQPNKGADVTSTNVQRFKGIKIEVLSQWPDDLLCATICSAGTDTNLWGACNLQDDQDVIQIDKLTAAGERYFLKVLMKMDTQIAFGEEVVIVDKRAKGGPEIITAVPAALTFPAVGGSQVAIVTATGDYAISGSHDGFTIKKVEGGIEVSCEKNATSADKTGSVVLTLTGSEKKVTVELFQTDGK